IKLFALNGSSYAGSYERVNGSVFRDYEEQTMSNIGPVDFNLEGVFTESASGWEYSFQPDKLILSKSAGETWEGAYSVFSWKGMDYLEYHLRERGGLAESRASYRIELEPDESALSVVLLHPVELYRLEAVRRTLGDVVRLEREQKLDDTELENLLPGR
ncbi:MAG: hypothetical protein AAF975_07110, partial [Spirochaetota bacterium]